MAACQRIPALIIAGEDHRELQVFPARVTIKRDEDVSIHTHRDGGDGFVSRGYSPLPIARFNQFDENYR